MLIKKFARISMLASFLVFSSVLQSDAYSAGRGFKYIDQGGIYTNTVTPVDVAKAENGETEVDLSNLKSGESVARNILYIVETGDASIDEAARKGGITKIKYVDSKTCKVFIPLGFIPILVRETRTIVYGE
jgi:hypothetical protein